MNGSYWNSDFSYPYTENFLPNSQSEKPLRKILPKPAGVQKRASNFSMKNTNNKKLKKRLDQKIEYSTTAVSATSSSTGSPAEEPDFGFSDSGSVSSLDHSDSETFSLSLYEIQRRSFLFPFPRKPSTADIDLFQPIIADDIHPLIPGNHF